MTTTISIQARMGSTRLPGKVLLSLPSKRLLAQVRAQCLTTKRPDDVVVAIGNEPPNEAIVEWCERTDCRYVEGPESNLLERHRRVAVETDCDVLVRITGDCPFVPPEEIDRVVGVNKQNDAVLTTNNT
jgi:spore coat polysaccharide biosynthesis protein SpsF